jgi:2-dehydro-3-deoxyphosphogluconate aldolase/(4S)-4-hydroxy-2-oxoglutarate aldolase
VLISIGTIKSGMEAQQFIDAGADFLISHVFDRGVCDAAYLNKTFWIPGCTTPTEIHVAQQAGCRLIKLFPGNVLGPGYVDAIRPLFRGIDFSITGGVETSEENISAWFKAGVSVVGMGSKLISKEILQNRDFEKLKTKTREVVAIIHKLKSAT